MSHKIANKIAVPTKKQLRKKSKLRQGSQENPSASEPQEEQASSLLVQELRRRTPGESSVIVDTSWMQRGVCADKDPNIFFPDNGGGVARASKFCAKCSVKEECLEYALYYKIEHGVWGGTSERERVRILKARRQEREQQKELAAQ